MPSARTPARLDQPKDSDKYAVPALEKAFDVIELLAQSASPLTLSQISVRLGRSVNELFRIVRGLEARGYVAAGDRGQAYQLTERLFSLGVNSPVTQNLVSVALPIMQTLTEDAFQACQLIVASDDQMVVIASLEAPGNLSFSVRVGFRQKLVVSSSGIILYAFENGRMKKLMKDRLSAETESETWNAFETKAQQALELGFSEERSPFVEGITDISCPVFSNATSVSALTMPMITTRLSSTTKVCVELLREAASKISTALCADAHAGYL